MPELCPNCLEFVCECPPNMRTKRTRPRAQMKAKIGEDTTPPATQGVGRGPTGKLRNFGAMADAKLLDVVRVLKHETPPDQEAHRKAVAELNRRGLKL